jgi:hypothetical protein
MSDEVIQFIGKYPNNFKEDMKANIKQITLDI